MALRTGKISYRRTKQDFLTSWIRKHWRRRRNTLRNGWAASNWYLNRAVRISIDYGNTNFAGGAAISAGGNRPPERALLQRFQINF